MPSEISLEIQSAEIIAKIGGITERMRNLKDALIDAGEEIITSVQENFEAEGRYSVVGSYIGGNTKWQELSPITKEIRKRTGRGENKILHLSGRLRDSITRSEPTNDSITVGTNLSYARMHQFGAKKGEYGTVTQYIREHKRKSKNGNMYVIKGHQRNVKNPAFNVPARPFLTVHPENLERINRNFSDYLLADLK